MDKVTKTFVSQIRSINEKDFTLEAVVSDETIDRYGEVIKVDAWKKRLGNYKRHPVLVTSHSYDKLTNQIGYADKVYVKDGELICKFKYFAGEGNAEADWGWKLASKFGQAAYSVGFLPFSYTRAEEKDYEEAKMGKKPFLTYDDVELLEVSQVLVPANPSALAKSFEDEKDLVVKEYVETMIDKMFDFSYDRLIAEDFNVKDVEEVVKIKAEKEITNEELKAIEEEYEEDEEMEKEAIIEAIKSYIDEKFAPLEKRLAKWEEEDLEYEEIAKELQKEIMETEEMKTTEEIDENYLKQLIEDANSIMVKHIPVQSE